MRERHLRVLAHVRTLTMTPGLPDPAGIAEARTFGWKPAAQRCTTVLEVSRIRYPILGRRTSGGREVEVDPGRSSGQSEFNSEFPVFFCVFFRSRGGTIYKRNQGATSIGSPMWDYSHMGGAPWQATPALVGHFGPTRVAALLFLFPI